MASKNVKRKKRIRKKKSSISKKKYFAKRAVVNKKIKRSKRKTGRKTKSRRRLRVKRPLIRGKGDYTDEMTLPVTVGKRPDNFVNPPLRGLTPEPMDPLENIFLEDLSDLRLEDIDKERKRYRHNHDNPLRIKGYKRRSDERPIPAAKMLDASQVIVPGEPFNAYAINPYPRSSNPDAFDNLMSDVELYRQGEMGLYNKYRKSKFVQSADKIVPRGTFGVLGGLAGGPLGYLAGSKFAQIAGFGEYKVKKNNLISEGQSPAYMHSTSSNAVIRHREYVCDIVSSPTSNAFNNVVFPINPGMNASFPWLSALAQQYQKYRIDGMVFEYKSMYSDAIASSAADGTLGYVIMGTEYNAVLPPFVNKQQMDNTEYSTSAKPSVSFYHPIECAPMSIPTDALYVRSGDPPSNADLRLYDLGNFQIATGGVNAPSVVLGELWVTYSITLMTPISTAAHGFTVSSDHFQLLNLETGPDVLGDDNTPVSGSTIGGKITNGNLYTFPPTIQDGNFMVVVHWQGSAGPGFVLPNITLVNCTALEIWNNDGSVLAGSGNEVTALSASMAFVINVDAPSGTPASISFDGGVIPYTADILGDLFVTQINSNIVT